MQKARHTSSSWRRCLARHSQRHAFQKLDMSEGSPLSPLATAFMEVCFAQSEISGQCVRGAQASGRALFVQVCTSTQQELEPTACTSALAFSGSIMVERCVWHHVDIAYIHRPGPDSSTAQRTHAGTRKSANKGSFGLQTTVGPA